MGGAGKIDNLDEQLLTVVASWFMSWPDPVVIADDRTFEILNQNRAAQLMFAMSPFVQNMSGRIHFSDPKVTDEFRAQVRDRSVEPIAICVDRDDEDCILAACIERPIPDARPNIVILTFRGRVAGKDVSGNSTVCASLARLFELTPAEERVARLLTAGDSVGNIGARLGVCVDTVRSHAQKIYLKVGVANREQLTARLMPLSFPSPRTQACDGDQGIAHAHR